jgi:putative CocE/NonD family hydrolase
MRIRTEFPRPIRVIDTAWIELSDGCRLAARVWLPSDAESDPVPAVVEYIPYRKNDGTASGDAEMHPYFAGHGYAAIRIDLRGSGDSDGVLYDEYLKQEQDDALEALRWIAAQPWCSGKVGIIGISWGGFNGLQIAARRPPELKAVVTVCSTDDRYGDDVHYIGGCLLPEGVSWAAVMLAYNARPPDPARVGDRWRELWLERMNETPPYIEAWLTHQRRDAFWKHGSICDSYGDVEVPVYAVGGWTDGYTTPVLRMLDRLGGPRKGLIGPWGHLYPHNAAPASCRTACAGGTTGSRASTRRSWTSRCCASGRRTRQRPRCSTSSGRGAG